MYWAFWDSFYMRAECFFLSKLCLPAVGLTQPAVEWVALSIEVKWSMKLSSCLHLVLCITLSGAIPLHPLYCSPSPDILTCGLYGPGIKSKWGQDFLHPSRLALGSYPTSCSVGTRSLSWGLHGQGMALPTSAEAKEECRYTCIPPLRLYVLFCGDLYL